MRLKILDFLGIYINFINLTDIYWAHAISKRYSKHNELILLPKGANEEGNDIILIQAERLSLKEYILGSYDFLHVSICDIQKFGVIPTSESKTVVKFLP